MTGTNRAPLWPEDIHEDDRDHFRVAQQFDIISLLRRVSEKSELVVLAADSQVSGLVTITEVDRDRRRVHFEANPGDVELRAAVKHDTVTAVCYLEHVKIQFPAAGLRWEAGVPGSRLSCALPTELFRFQRRSFFRVRPQQSAAPIAHMAPFRPGPEGGALDPAGAPNKLDVLDISMTGIGLFLPDNVAPYEAGTTVPDVLIALEPGLHIQGAVRIMHLTQIDGVARRGQKMGCTLSGVSREDLRTLQKFIDRTQMRRREMGEGLS